MPRGVTGYPRRAHGGYVAGSLALSLGRPAEVTLKAPVPVGRDLVVATTARDRVTLSDGEAVLASAVPGDVEQEPPPPVSPREAREASRQYLGLRWHPYPWCFVCGPRKREGQGLRVFAGPVDGSVRVAATWIPTVPIPMDDPGSLLAWCALDCPGAWALWETGSIPSESRLVTRRLAVQVVRPVRPGAPHVVVAEPRSHRGRLFVVAGAIYLDSGELVARAQATWFRP
ncbi:MAG TPA: hypothetical protein VK977_09975 [Actinomycetota bacterium]|nr:hypothetical protein [Actinomycetota bacterium]